MASDDTIKPPQEPVADVKSEHESHRGVSSLSAAELIKAAAEPTVLIQTKGSDPQNIWQQSLCNKAAKAPENKDAINALVEGVSQSSTPSRVQVEGRNAAWISQSFGGFSIYRLVGKDEDTEWKALEELRESEKQVERYNRYFHDVRMDVSTLMMEFRVRLNGTLGLSEMLVDAVQPKSLPLPEAESRKLHEIASVLRDMLDSTVHCMKDFSGRFHGLQRVAEGRPITPPPPPPVPKDRSNILTDPPRPIEDKLLYEHVPNIRVLVIEDNLVNQKVMCRIMEKGRVSPENIITAVDPEEGLRKLSDPDIDLVFVDFSLPKMDGSEVVRRIMAPEMRMNFKPWFTVVGLVVSTMNGTYEKMKEAGATEVLCKPLRTGRIWGQCLRVAEMKRHGNLPPLPWKL